MLFFFLKCDQNSTKLMLSFYSTCGGGGGGGKLKVFMGKKAELTYSSCWSFCAIRCARILFLPTLALQPGM